ncbi:MAG: hypothetical protein AAFX51_14085 [Cyanobacteria bacterium J06636_28]
MSTVALLGGTAAPSLAQVIGTTAAEEFGEDVIFLEPDADAVPEAQSDFVEPVLPDAIPEDGQDEPAADEPATPPQEVTETPAYIERFNAGLAQYREGNDELALGKYKLWPTQDRWQWRGQNPLRPGLCFGGHSTECLGLNRQHCS